MAKNQEIDFSTTAASNTDVGGISIDEGIPPSNVNDAMRYIAKARADAITRYVAKTQGTYTAAKTDHAQFWDFTGAGASTLNLTAAATLTSGWCIYFRTRVGITLTIDPNGSENIDSASTKVIPGSQTGRIICTGSEFFIQNLSIVPESWVTYTPTFTGFGTAVGPSVWSKRIGDTLYVRGYFTSGTCTATEARMTLGYNGTSANVTSDATKVAAIQLCGQVAQGVPVASQMVVLIGSNVGYVTFGIQAAGTAALTAILGTAFTDATKYSFQFDVPISGW